MTLDERSAFRTSALWNLWIKRRSIAHGRVAAAAAETGDLSDRPGRGRPRNGSTAPRSRRALASRRRSRRGHVERTGPSEHTTAGIRVSRSTGSRMPTGLRLGHRQERPQPGVEQLGEAPATAGLEAGDRVVRRPLVATRRQGCKPEEDVGVELVGGLGLQRAVGVVERHDLRPGHAQGWLTRPARAERGRRARRPRRACR